MANSWKDIRSKLMRCSENDLIGLIQDLYKLDSRNKDFLQAKFTDNSVMIKKYSDEIVKSFKIKQGSDPWNYTINLQSARNALRDYKKATGDGDGLIALMMVYAECGLEVITAGYSHKESYYISIRKMVINLLTEFQTNPLLADTYFSRMKKILIKGEKFCGFARELDPSLVADYF